MMHDNETRGGPGRTPGFEELDPSRDDVWYWARFQDRVMAETMPELLRRQRSARVTFAQVMESWSRLLVPGMVAAAAVAATLLLSQAEPPSINDSAVVLEELMFPVGPGQEELPDFLVSGDALDRDAVLFAVEGY